MSALLIVFLVALAAYLLPAFVANARQHPSRAGILVLNLLLGWTFLFWALALVWAFSGENQARYDRRRGSGRVRVSPPPYEPMMNLSADEWLPDETRREFEERIAQARVRRLH